VPKDIVDAAIDRGVKERPAMPGIEYFGFADPAGGTGKDSFTICIGHRGPDNMVVIDCLRERQPRFVPKDVVKEFSDLLKLYRVSKITSDKYAMAWASDEWARDGIICEQSTLTKSEIYLAALPVLMSAQCRLLDNERLRDQLTGLERRVYASGREAVDDSGAQSAHDDLANVACGVLVNLSFEKREAPQPQFGVYGSGGYGFNGAYTTHDPNAGAGAVYASMPAAWWTPRGVYHPNDSDRWIREGVTTKRPSEIK
jgi:hypothetical protein